MCFFLYESARSWCHSINIQLKLILRRKQFSMVLKYVSLAFYIIYNVKERFLNEYDMYGIT